MSDHTEMAERSEEGSFPNALSKDFAQALDAAQIRASKSDFTGAVGAFKQVESEFIPRAGGDQAEILEMKRRVAESILKAAIEGGATFEICRDCWTDLLQLGFTNLDRRCTMTWYFATGCRLNKQSDAGLAVLDPLIAELTGLLDASGEDENAAEYYQYELENLGNLHAKLQAQRAASPAT